MSPSQADRSYLDSLADEFVERYRRGERPAISEFAARCPEHADEIREIFPTLVMMEELAPEGDGQEASAQTRGRFQAPVRLGDFEIIREIGRGGMGIVYEAEQQSLGRRVAVKVLTQSLLLDPQSKRRFEREARAAAKLHHTNIVPVFGLGHEAGFDYYVMQHIAGLPLDEVLAEVKRLRGCSNDEAKNFGSVARQSEAAAVAESFVSGMNELAASGSAEGEDQPTNTREQARPSNTADSLHARAETTQLFDATLPIDNSRSASREIYWRSVARLGAQVAEALQYAHDQGVIHRDIKPSNLLLDTRGTVWVTDFGLAKAIGQNDLTRSGGVLGTLRYMAPEQFQGMADERSDIYSLGLTLHELLTLEPAFCEIDRAMLLKQVSRGVPASLLEIDPRIPGDLATIVQKTCDTEPAHRYQTAGELAADLNRYLAGEPIQARRIWAATRLVRWCKRNPTVAAMTSTIALLVVVVAAIGVLAYGRSIREAEARLALKLAEVEKEAAELRTVQVEQQRSIQERSRVEAEQRAQAAEAQRREAQVNALVEEAQRLCSGSTPDFVRAIEQFTEALRHRPAEGRLYLFRGSARYELGDYDEATADLERSLELQSGGNPAAHWLLGLISQQEGDDAKALRHLDQARREQPDSIKSLVVQALAVPFDQRGVELLTQAIAKDPFDPLLYFYRGRTSYNLTVRKAAQRDYRAATEDLEKAILGRPYDLRVVEMLARCLTDFHFLDVSSARALARARQLTDQWLEESPSDTTALCVLSQWQRASGQSREAVATCQRALQGQPRPNYVLCQLGWAYRDLRLHEQAVESLSRAIGENAELGTGRETMISAYLARATSNYALGHKQQAQQDVDRAVQFSSPQGWTFFDWYSVVSAMRTLGNREEALSWCKRFIEVAPDCSQAWQLFGLLHEDQGKHRDAAENFIKAIGLNPGLESPYIGLLGVYLKTGDTQAGLVWCDRWLAARPESNPAFRWRGLYRLNAKQYSQAVLDLNEAVRLEPRDARAHYHRGRAHDLLKQFDEASADFDRALALDAKDFDVYLARGRLYFSQQRHEQAASDLTQYLSGRNGDASVWRMRGEAWRKMERNEEALADLNRAIELDPNNAIAHVRRGLVHAALKRHDQAVVDYVRSIELDPKELWVHRRLVESHFALKDYAAALRTCDAWLEQNPDDEAIYDYRGHANIYLRRYQAAVADFNRALPIRPQDSLLHYRRAEAYRNLGRYAEALTDCDAAIGLDGGAAPYHFLRGRILVHLDDWEGAVAAYSRALELNPRERFVRGAMVNAQCRLGNFAAALEFCTRWLGDESDSTEGYRNRALVHYCSGDYESALGDLQAALSREPSDYLSLFYRGQNYIALNDRARGFADIAKSLEICPAAQAAEHHGVVGDFYGESAEWPLAAASLAKAVQLEPLGIRRAHLLALAQLSVGDESGYLKTLKQMLQHGLTRDPNAAELIVWTGIVRSAAGDAEQLTALANLTVESRQDSALCRCALGAMLYRAGRLQDALTQLARAEQLAQPSESAASLSVCLASLRALTHHELGDEPLARRQLEQALAIPIATGRIRRPIDVKPSEWNHRVIAELLRKEASAVIAGMKH